MISRALATSADEEVRLFISLAMIVAADVYQILIGELIAKGGQADAVRARHACQELLRQCVSQRQTGMTTTFSLHLDRDAAACGQPISLPNIGFLFNRDHSGRCFCFRHRASPEQVDEIAATVLSLWPDVKKRGLFAAAIGTPSQTGESLL